MQVRVVVVRVSGRVVVIGVCGLVAAQAWLVGWSSWPLPGRADRGQPPVQRSDIGGSAGDRGAPPKIAPGRAGPRPRPGCRRSLAGVLADPALGQLFGIVVDPAGGTTLWGRNSTAPQLPAATAKLLTGAALLTSVNPTVRFVTRVVPIRWPRSTCRQSISRCTADGPSHNAVPSTSEVVVLGLDRGLVVLLVGR